MFHKLIVSVIFMGPLKSIGPLMGPLMAPGVIVTPCPPSRWPCLKATSAEAQKRSIFSHCLFLSSRRSGGFSLGFRAGSL